MQKKIALIAVSIAIIGVIISMLGICKFPKVLNIIISILLVFVWITIALKKNK
jgi:hypothetical protein